MKSFQFTKDGFEKLKKELEDLTGKKRPYAVDRLQRARAMGDLSENSEYVAAKEDLAFIEGRIQELEEVVKNAIVVETHVDAQTIEIGSHIVVTKAGREEEFTIVGEFEADPLHKKVSYTSPLGKALLDKKIGEEVEITAPAGKHRYKILAIKKI
ncbi:transcription elongation factor GreA [Candidatus Roizmanbacteria bacterium]|nr:transcription elongation factor GreA [Candidatus Roizmanbacteria bacterium]